MNLEFYSLNRARRQIYDETLLSNSLLEGETTELIFFKSINFTPPPPKKKKKMKIKIVRFFLCKVYNTYMAKIYTQYGQMISREYVKIS